MEVFFRTRQLQRVCSEEREMKRELGQKMAAKLKQRLMEMRGADTLADLSYLPPTRFHELHQNRAGQFSVDLEHPMRLIFIPANDPVPKKTDGGIDRAQITAIEIIEITDPHPKR